MRSRKALGLLTATHGVNDFYQAAVPALLPFLMAERGYSYALLAGITLAATGLSSLLQPAFGALVDRRPMPWLVIGGMATAGVGLGLAGVTEAYALTWLAVAVSGIGGAAYHPAGAKAARAAGGGSAGTMSVFSVGGNIGTAIAPLCVAFTLGRTGVDGTWLLAIPAMAMTVLYVIAQRAMPSAVITGRTQTASGRNDWRAFARLSALAVCWSIPYVVTGSFAALYLIDRFDVTEQAGSALLTCFTVGGVVGTLAGGWAAGRLGRMRTIHIGYMAAVAAAAGVAFAPHPAAVAVFAGLLGATLFVPFAAQITLAQDYLPGRVGMASGVTLGLTLSCGGLLSPLFGLMADRWGPQPVMATLIAILFVAVVLAYRLPEPQRAETPKEPLTSADATRT